MRGYLIRWLLVFVVVGVEATLVRPLLAAPPSPESSTAPAASASSPTATPASAAAASRATALPEHLRRRLEKVPPELA
ncbi:MAG: hypothetical protein ACKOBW_14900, partial [Planctomycetota bacterium]